MQEQQFISDLGQGLSLSERQHYSKGNKTGLFCFFYEATVNLKKYICSIFSFTPSALGLKGIFLHWCAALPSFPNDICLCSSPLLGSLHSHTKHLYMVSVYSTLTLMALGMRVKWTIKGIRYLLTTWSHTQMHTERGQLHNNEWRRPLCNATEGACYHHKASCLGEGTGDGLWNIRGKTSLSVQRCKFWLGFWVKRKRGSNGEQITEGEWEWQEKGSSIKCIS